MDFLKQWIFGICLTLIICIIFSFMTPSGSIGKFYKIIISLFIFVSFTYPLIGFDFSELKPDFEFDFSSEYISAAENEVESIIKDELNKNGINNAEINVSVNENNDEIEVENITICINEADNAENVKSLLFNDLGLLCEVVSRE